MAKPAKKPPPRSAVRTDAGQFDGSPTPPGMGALSHRPKKLTNPPTFAARRAASRSNAYPNQALDDE